MQDRMSAGGRGQERKMVKALKNGDFDAYGFLIRKYQGPVTKACVSLTGDMQSGCELAIHTLLSLWTDRESVRTDIPFRRFLVHRIVQVNARRSASKQDPC